MAKILYEVFQTILQTFPLLYLFEFYIIEWLIQFAIQIMYPIFFKYSQSRAATVSLEHTFPIEMHTH